MAELIDRTQLDMETDIIEPDCPYFGACGGCKYQDINYEAQLAGKKRILKRIFSPLIGEEEAGKIEFHPAGSVFRYRNKMEFTFSEFRRELVLGLHMPGSFAKIVDIEDCLISPEAFADIMRCARESAAASGVRAYNPRNKKGFWRYLTLRYSYAQDSVMAVIVTKPGDRKCIKEMADKIRSQCGKVKSIYWGVNDKLSDVAVPDELILIYGEEYLTEKIGNVELNIYPFNFLQPNISRAADIYAAMTAFLPQEKELKVLDLYCGIGSIGLYMAKNCSCVEELVGVEIDEANIESALNNMKLNEITNAAFVQANIEKQLKQDELFIKRFDADIIILDPPRSGLHKKVYKPLIAGDIKYIFYLSCNAKSMAGDLNEIMSRAPEYKIRHISAYDMFPQTPHFETLVILARTN